MHFFDEVGLLTAMNDLETLAAQIAFERLAREWPAVATAAGQIGDALRANLLGVHAAGGHLAALSGAERLGLVVARDGDLSAEHEQPGVEVMAVVGFFHVRPQAGENGPEAVAPQFRFEFGLVHLPLLLAWLSSSVCSIKEFMSTIENDISVRTGRAVKQQRDAAGFSLRMLATRSGISPSMISDIERGAKSPTVTTVVRLAQALGVSASALIDGGTGPTPRIRVLRRGQGAGGEHPAPWESLGPAAPGSRIDFVRYQIPPSTVLGPSPAHASGTVEHMHVATGTVRVTVGDETADLVAGDSCSCRTDAPHGVENPDPSAEALIYLIVERS